VSGVTKPNYPYPEDEFDQAALHAGPRGVHRQPRKGLRRWWPLVAVVVLAPALAYGLVTFLSHSGTSSKIPGFSSLTEDSTGTPTPSETTSPTVTPTAPATATAPATPTSTPTPTDAAPALGTKVQVLNGGGASGVAAKAAAKLTAAGFTSVTAGNYGGAAVSGSTVFYATAAEAVTAKAVGTALGITQLKVSATQASGGIVVVLKSDYKP
jgi:hypothetical protein